VSKGTALQHRQYRLRELRGIFWRTELLPVTDELRKDAAKKRPSKDPHAGLEEDAIALLGKDIAAVTETGVTKTTDPDAKRFMGAEVVKSFSDGVFAGKVVGHVPDLDNNELEDGEMFVIQYESGKQETVDSQELMSMLVGAQEEEEGEEEEEEKEEDPDNLQETKEPDSPKPKAKKKTKEDKLIGRKVQTWMDVDDEEVQVKGRIVSKSKKTSGKKKGVYYLVEYDDSKLDVEIPDEKIHVSDIKDMLV
jgi:RNase P/RNase MRP subunit p29